MTPLPAKVNRGIMSERKKVVKSEIELGLPFINTVIVTARTFEP